MDGMVSHSPFCPRFLFCMGSSMGLSLLRVVHVHAGHPCFARSLVWTRCAAFPGQVSNTFAATVAAAAEVNGTHPIVQQYNHFGMLLGAHWWAQGLCLATSFPTCAHVCHLHCLLWMRLARREYEFFDRFDFWHQPTSCPRFHSSTSSLHVHMILMLSLTFRDERAMERKPPGEVSRIAAVTLPECANMEHKRVSSPYPQMSTDSWLRVPCAVGIEMLARTNLGIHAS